MSFRVLFQDEHLIAIDKPAGFHVHPPEDRRHAISPSFNCLYLLRNQTQKFLYPVHRLDRATSGVLVFAFQSETARILCDMFQKQEPKKTYFCVTRGWTEKEGLIAHPLKSDTRPGEKLEAETSFQQVATVELPFEVGRYPSARYSLLKVQPKSGRKHQIRRHLDSISHPLLGDTIYGSGEHNRVFREKLKIQGLLLKAYSLEITHPITRRPMKIVSRWNGLWHQVFDLFGVCPFESNL